MLNGVTYLLVKLDECWFEQGIDLFSQVVWVLGVTQTFAHFVLGLQEVLLHLSWKGMEWYNHVSGISDLFELDMGYFLMVHDCGVVSWDESWKFWYVGSHF